MRPTSNADLADRRRRRAQGQPRAARRDREGRRHEEPAIHAARRAASTARRTPSPRSSKRNYKEGDVIVIRYEGPRGGPGMREMLSTTGGALRPGRRREGGADHRRPLLRRARTASASAMSGRRRRSAARSACCGRRHRSRSTRSPARSMSRSAMPSWRQRRKAWKPRRHDYQSGTLWKYAQTVGDAEKGAVTHPGGRPRRMSTRISERGGSMDRISTLS